MKKIKDPNLLDKVGDSLRSPPDLLAHVVELVEATGAGNDLLSASEGKEKISHAKERLVLVSSARINSLIPKSSIKKRYPLRIE